MEFADSAKSGFWRYVFWQSVSIEIWRLFLNSINVYSRQTSLVSINAIICIHSVAILEYNMAVIHYYQMKLFNICEYLTIKHYFKPYGLNNQTVLKDYIFWSKFLKNKIIFLQYCNT